MTAPSSRTARLARLASALIWPVWILIVANTGIEIALTLADGGWIGSRSWRSDAYQYGAFWPGLLRDWRPNYAVQPVAMFFSYGFLHAGAGHLLGNMVALGWLGMQLGPALGSWRFLGLYLATALGGGAAFALDGGYTPMVGASGALFGLAGAWMALDWRRLRRSPAEGGRGLRAALWRGAQMATALVALNVLSWLMQGGLIAWQAHLGGALTGVALCAALPARREGAAL